MTNRLLLAILTSFTIVGGTYSTAAVLPKLASSYEVTTVTKAEDMKAYLALSKASYAICAELRALQKLPIKPYPAVPNDFIVEQSIYSSDGESFYEKKEKTEASLASVDEQCLVVFGTYSSTKITRGNLTQTIDEDIAGVVTVDSGENNSQYTQRSDVKKSELASFSIHKNKNGIAMRCLDVSLLGKVLDNYEQCVFDGPNESSLFDGYGKPIDLYFRLPPIILGSVMDTIRVTEVKKIEFGKRVDPKIFVFK